MRFVYSDGGRSNYFRATNVSDCVVRAIANATGVDYKEAYDAINTYAKKERKGACRRGKSSARDGVYKETYRKYLEGDLGWVFVPCMGIGTGCTTHLRDGELPVDGSYVVKTSRHLTCVREGALVDTYDCSRDADRCVYGYWRAPTESERAEHALRKAQKASLDAKRKADAEDLAKRREEARKANKKVMASYAKRIRELRAKLRRLEKERDSKLVEVPSK